MKRAAAALTGAFAAAALAASFAGAAQAAAHNEAASKAADFVEAFKIASPDFQDEFGYGESPLTPETLTMGSPHISHAFGCLSLTLEMPFKDNANDPDPVTGWDGARSARLGAAILQPVLMSLRANG
eukprot:gene36495-45008_t